MTVNDVKVPILDVVLVLGCTALGLSPWPWLVLAWAAAYFAVLAWVIDRRTPPPEVHE